MKTSTKVLIGVGAVTILGSATVIAVSEKLIGKISSKKNRYKIKHFITDHMGGNEKMLSIVDDLTDEDVSALLNFADKLRQSKKQVVSYGENVKEITEEVKNRLHHFFEELI